MSDYTWTAVFPNGTTIYQRDEAGTERSTSELQGEFIFRLEGPRIVNIDIKEDTELIYLRRNLITPNGKEIIVIAGFQWKDTGKLKLVYLREDGSIEEKDSL